MFALEVVFWLCLAALVYVYAGFPLLVAIMGAVRGRKVRKTAFTPKVSLVIAAYNEEQTIAEKIENSLALDYPHEQLEVVVVSDGSTDATERIVATYANEGVKLIQRPRQGKIHALNAAVREATGDVLVFSDANTMYDRQAMMRLGENFADPRVGGVAGNSMYRKSSPLTNAEASREGEELYWRYDTWLKEMESQTGSIVSAHGGMYGVRRELYWPPSTSAVTDDFAISTAVVEQGYRLVFEREAIAYEDAVSEADREFRRKVRLMTRGLRGLVLRRRLLNPFRYGFYSLVLFSHKVLRRLLPLALVVLFTTSLVLAAASTWFAIAAGAQVCFYAVAALGYAMRRAHVGRAKVLFIPFFYCLANLAALVALWQLIRGRRIELWEPQRHTT